MTAGRKGTWSDGGTDGELLAGTADRLRWRAPELTLVFARQAATRADEAKDRALALRANALMVAALVRLGKHAEAVEPAVAALREAETAGERDLAGSVRVDLAASTRAVGLTGSAFVLVRPMLEGSDTRPAVRAGALAEIVGGLAQAGRLDVIDEVLSEADRLYAADELLSGDVRRILRALLCARIASFRRRWGNATGAVAAATEGLTLLDGLSDPGTDSGQARAELGLEMVCALLDAGEEAAAVGQADQTLTQPVRATSAAAIGRLMLILATRVHFPAGRPQQAHALLAEIVRVARRHELDGLLADVLTSLAYAQESDGELTEALNSLRSARAAEQRRLRADTLARLIVLEELGAGTRLPDDTESLLRRVVRTPIRSAPETPGTEVSSREAASREMSGRELSGRGIGPGPRPRPTRGGGTYDSVGYERAGQGTEDYDLAATASQDYEAAASQSTPERYSLTSGDYSVSYDLEGYPTLTRGYDLATSLGLAGDDDTGTTSDRVGRRRSASTAEPADTRTGTTGSGTTGTGVGMSTGTGFGTGSDAGTTGGGGGEGGGGGGPRTSGLAAGGGGTHDLLGRELAGWEMVARERAAMELAGQTRAGSDLVAADRAAPEWAGADPAAVDRVVGRAAVDRAAVDMHGDDSERADADTVETVPVESESDWAATAAVGSTSASEQPSRPKGRRAADADKPKWPDASQNERDEETGLLNRQGLRRRLAAARRQARPTALTLVRLEPSGDEPEPEPRRKDPDSTDRFSAALIKAIDTVGAGRLPPEFAPDVLASLADHVRDMAPRDAELARPDEGELAVLLPDTTRDEAEQFAATLRETVSTSDWAPEDPARGVNVSTGVAQYQEGTSEDALLSAAREALTHTEQEPERPDWQSVEPLYDLPPEDSGYTFIQEYAGLSSDVDDPEMAEYLAGFPLPDYGRQWPSADEPGMPQDDSADDAEGGRSVLDRLDITRGSGGRRRAPDAFKSDQSSDYDHYAINQPMTSYSNTGDEILAAAEEGERASIPQPPDPDEVPTPPDSPEVPIPPDPDVEPQPGRRRRPAEPDEPDDDPLQKPSPRPKFPTGPDIPAPDDPDADPDPRRRRWTSESDPENPRARRRALPRDPSRRAVEPDDDPETTGRRRMPDTDETPAAQTRPGESTGRRRMPEAFEEPEFSTRIEAPKPDVGQPAGRRRMPEWPADQEPRSATPETRTPPEESTGRRRMPELPDGNDGPGASLESRTAPGELTGRRRIPGLPQDTEERGLETAPGESKGRRLIPNVWPSEPETTGRRRMPEDESESGRRRKPESVAENEVVAEPSDPERTGRRRKPDTAGDFESQWDPADVGRRRKPDPSGLSEPEGHSEALGALGTFPADTAGRRRAPEPSGADDMPGRPVPDGAYGETTGRRRMPEPPSGAEMAADPAGRRTPDSRGVGEKTRPNLSESLGLEAILGEAGGQEAVDARKSGTERGQQARRANPGQDAADARMSPIERGQSGKSPDRDKDADESAGRRLPGALSGLSRSEDRPSGGLSGLDAILGDETGRTASDSQSSRGRSDASSVRDAILGQALGRRIPGDATESAPGAADTPGEGTPPRSSMDRQKESERRTRFVGLEGILGEAPQGRRRAPESDTPVRRGEPVTPPPQRHEPASPQRPEPAPRQRHEPAGEAMQQRHEFALPPEQSGPVDDFPTNSRPEPASRPDTFSRPEPISRSEPASRPEPINRPEPISRPAPVSRPEPEPEPVSRPEPISRPGPISRPEPVSRPEPANRPEVFSLGPEGLSRRAPVTDSSVSNTTEPVEKPIQPDESPVARRLSSPGVDELSKRRQTEGRPERPRRRTERAADEAGDDRPSRLRRRERTDLKLADLLAEALVAYQSSTSEDADEDVLSAYQDLDTATGDDPERHRGETGY